MTTYLSITAVFSSAAKMDGTAFHSPQLRLNQLSQHTSVWIFSQPTVDPNPVQLVPYRSSHLTRQSIKAAWSRTASVSTQTVNRKDLFILVTALTFWAERKWMGQSKCESVSACEYECWYNHSSAADQMLQVYFLSSAVWTKAHVTSAKLERKEWSLLNLL